ncbi:MAG: STAS domain-containing protein [Solirubrobacteraceae bacterium]|jgi:anti-sigma B factor antagonist
MQLQPSPRSFRVEAQLERGVAVLSLFGALDMFAIDLFETKLKTVEVQARRVVLDLRGLTALESSGLGVILRAQTRSRVDGWHLAVVRGIPKVDAVFSKSPLARGVRMVKNPDGLFSPRSEPVAG